MALRGDTYGSIAGVLAYTREVLDGQTTFNSTTRPTLTEVEGFMDQASGALNVALNGIGLTTPITNSTAKLICSAWVNEKGVYHVNATKAGSGFDGSRAGSFSALQESADEFCETNALGFKRLGVGVSSKLSAGLQFTGLDVQSDRLDPDDTSLEQPKFVRGKFDAVSTSNDNDGSS